MTIRTLFRDLLDHIGPDHSATNHAVVDEPGIDKVEQEGSHDKEDHILVGGVKDIGGAAYDADENERDLLVVHPLEFNGLLFEPESIQ